MLDGGNSKSFLVNPFSSRNVEKLWSVSKSKFYILNRE